MGRGDVAGRADVGLADFDETAPARQQLQRSVDELSGKAVEHDVHALPVGGLAEGVEEIQRARGGDVPGVDPQPGEHVMFVRVGGGENLRTKVAGDLDGGLTDTSRAGVDEHPLPRRERGDLDQSDIGGEEGHRNRRGLGKRPSRRDRYHHALIGAGGGRERVAGEQAHHRITRAQGCHIGSGFDDHPGGFGAEAFIGDGAQRHDHIMEVQPGRPYLNADLTRGQRRRADSVGSRVRLVRSPLPVVANCQSGASGGVRVKGRARRGMWATPLRRASCGSPAGRVEAMASRLSWLAAVLSVSSKMIRSGCSFWAVWISPQTAACARSGTPSYALTLTACEVRISRRAVGGVGPGQPALQLGQHVAGQGMHPPQRISLPPASSSGRGSGQITNSGQGATVARSV